MYKRQSADRAAVAVSRGALDKLSRDELQAVVGHEFSHILNGDMQLNIRLVGWIFGLIVISLLGQILLRAGAFSPRTRSRDGKNAAALVLLIGVGLLAIGFISQIFAQIIQAAISRHRERLADASATQFTRNPKALANALSRIGGDAAGSRISSPRAGEFAHLFFASGVNALFATHPPLEERIRALDPSWDGEFLPPLSAPERAENAEANLSGLRNVSETNSVPPFLAEMTRNADDAKTLICLLMMTDSPERNVEQAKILLEREKSAVFKKMEHLWERMRNFPREKRIAAVLVAAPALRELSARDRREFCETLDLLAQTDGNVSIFEFCILAAVRGLLLSESQRKLSPSDVRSEAELVLNFFLRGNKTPRSRWAQDLSAALAKQTMFPGSLRVLDDAALNFPALEAAFRKLRASPIRIREQLLFTARDVIAADGEITPEENDVLSAFAVALACPAPQGSV
ncbi:MAG TPA: M48 family metalloprotease [Candidatus Spyradosoma merdigallinarum]|uniref:M48 family metalloprotease n=1 Tax=Candidatus Spyradosoma merdigallinarum TaxID=2840950 RepID=A0A9D1T0P2_9BACT|nr:M48 family metalloprotease [Candidatus Spyradosoma merdigallinarum]